jgi:hypothetical protein
VAARVAAEPARGNTLEAAHLSVQLGAFLDWRGCAFAGSRMATTPKDRQAKPEAQPSGKASYARVAKPLKWGM